MDSMFRARRRLALLALAGVVMLSDAIIGTLKSETKRSQADDSMFIEALKGLAQKKVPLSDIENQLGKKARVNTKADGDKLSLSLFNLERDELDPSLPYADDDFDDCQDVVFWIRPGKQSWPRVVGIYVTDKGEYKIFYAMLFPKG